MKQIGIRGFQNIEVGMRTPQVIDQMHIYVTTDWEAAFAYTAHLTGSLNLEMAIAIYPGWSESSDPCASAEDGIKKLVWQELIINGSKSLSGIYRNISDKINGTGLTLN